MAYENSEPEWAGPGPPRRSLILCFDGTGNKFQGDSGDSNILKIYSMLEKASGNHYTYYQPGIGTYIEDSALSKSSRLAKFRSWYIKAKDQAVGTSFDSHVEGGYKFLMQYYSQDDDLYFFGFSRGAYIARFLAQMLDSVGLLNSGNEEMFRFAWKAFAQWQTRLEETAKQKGKKKDMYDFMKAFRETFSRPVRRIRFMGLFDTVNSVPRFENRWMQRSKFPYAANSSARIVRHAVAIDERRAKFRQNLISQKKDPDRMPEHRFYHKLHDHGRISNGGDDEKQGHGNNEQTSPPPFSHHSSYARYMPRKASLAVPLRAVSSQASQVSLNSVTAAQERPKEQVAYGDDDEENSDQDIEEIWFPGCHADIGGGWCVERKQGELVSLSYGPLIWMIREARKAGLPFDDDALRESGFVQPDGNLARNASIPHLQIDGRPTSQSPIQETQALSQSGANVDSFFDRMHLSATKGLIHDGLAFNTGTPFAGVISWRIMEYLPFRRMDLRPDGTWAPIRFPLPMGEVRDIPKEAWIHNSALRRMQLDENYRPGNLIIGGGGRGVKRAPDWFGIGRWKILREEGDPVGEVIVRAMDKNDEGVIAG